MSVITLAMYKSTITQKVRVLSTITPSVNALWIVLSFLLTTHMLAYRPNPISRWVPVDLLSPTSVSSFQ